MPKENKKDQEQHGEGPSNMIKNELVKYWMKQQHGPRIEMHGNCLLPNDQWLIGGPKSK